MTLWGGRFDGAMSEVTRRFTGDESDRRLLPFDIRGSIAHVTMLGETGTIDAAEASQLVSALQAMLDTVDIFEFHPDDEDVHTAVERRLGELVGDVAGKLHTGRSRNDQVALDLRLYLVAAAGAYTVNGVAAKARDGVAVRDVETLEIVASEDTELLLADVA